MKCTHDSFFKCCTTYSHTHNFTFSLVYVLVGNIIRLKTTTFIFCDLSIYIFADIQFLFLYTCSRIKTTVEYYNNFFLLMFNTLYYQKEKEKECVSDRE